MSLHETQQLDGRLHALVFRARAEELGDCGPLAGVLAGKERAALRVAVSPQGKGMRLAVVGNGVPRMRAELIQNRVVRPVKDAYGRYVGAVVGFSVDTSGELSSIGLDQCINEEFPAINLILQNQAAILTNPKEAES